MRISSGACGDFGDEHQRVLQLHSVCVSVRVRVCQPGQAAMRIASGRCVSLFRQAYESFNKVAKRHAKHEARVMLCSGFAERMDPLGLKKIVCFVCGCAHVSLFCTCLVFVFVSCVLCLHLSFCV